MLIVLIVDIIQKWYVHSYLIILVLKYCRWNYKLCMLLDNFNTIFTLYQFNKIWNRDRTMKIVNIIQKLGTSYLFLIWIWTLKNPTSSFGYNRVTGLHWVKLNKIWNWDRTMKIVNIIQKSGTSCLFLIWTLNPTSSFRYSRGTGLHWVRLNKIWNWDRTMKIVNIIQKLGTSYLFLIWTLNPISSFRYSRNARLY